MTQPHTVSLDINGQPLSLETGKVAKQADGAVVVRYGGSMVLATCVASKTAREGQDFCLNSGKNAAIAHSVSSDR